MDTCWLQGSSTHVSVYKPRLMQPRYSHALVGCVRNDSRCGIFVNMAAKKKVSPPSKPAKVLEQAKQAKKRSSNSSKNDLGEERTTMRQVNRFNKNQKKMAEMPKSGEPNAVWRAERTGMFAYPERTGKGKLVPRVANYTSSKPNTFPKVSGYATGQKKPKKK